MLWELISPSENYNRAAARYRIFAILSWASAKIPQESLTRSFIPADADSAG